MNERIICEFCDTDILKRTRNKHYRTKKCTKAREELAKQQIVSDKEKITALEKQATEMLVLKKEKDKEMLILKKENDKLQNIINKKDEFIQSLASRPSTSTTHNNNFSMNQYFEGNHGLELYNDDYWNEKTKYGILMMQNTVDEYGYNPEKIIETKQKQFEHLFKDGETGKWNAVITDTSRNTVTLCTKTPKDDRVATIKDPKGEIVDLKSKDIQEGNKPIIIKSSDDVDTNDMTNEERYKYYGTLRDLINIKFSEAGKLPTKDNLK